VSFRGGCYGYDRLEYIFFWVALGALKIKSSVTRFSYRVVDTLLLGYSCLAERIWQGRERFSWDRALCCCLTCHPASTLVGQAVREESLIIRVRLIDCASLGYSKKYTGINMTSHQPTDTRQPADVWISDNEIDYCRRPGKHVVVCRWPLPSPFPARAFPCMSPCQRTKWPLQNECRSFETGGLGPQRRVGETRANFSGSQSGTGQRFHSAHGRNHRDSGLHFLQRASGNGRD
jgi:hypothetical protein